MADPPESVQEDSASPSDALNSYVEAERAALPTVLADNPGVFSEITVEAEAPSTVVFSYWYQDPRDAAATASSLDDAIPELQSSLDSVVFPAMADAGVEGTLSVSFVYYNADGSLIWENTFASS